MWLLAHFPGQAVGALVFVVIVALAQVVIWLMELAMVQRERWRRGRQ